MEAPAIGRVAALDAGLPVTVDRAADRPALRLRAAGRALRGDAGAERRVGGRARGRRRVDVRTRRSTRRRCAGASSGGPGVMLHDALARGRVTAGRRQLPGARRDDRDRGEPAPRVRHLPRGAGRVGGAQPPARGRGAGGGPLRRRDRPGRGEVVARTSTVRSDTDEHIRRMLVRRWRAAAGAWAATTRTPPSRRATPAGQNDGAAICVVTHPERAAELGLRPLARLVSWGVGGVPPATMGIGPVPADREGPAPRPGSRWPTWT